MKNKLAKLKYLPNNFSIIEEGAHVLCAISGKKNSFRKFNLLECRRTGGLFFLRRSINKKRWISKIKVISSTYCVSKSIDQDFLISFFLKFY